MKLSIAVALCLIIAAVLPPKAGAHGAAHQLLAALAQDIAKHPNDPKLIVQRATLELEHEDWQAALVDLEKASRLGSCDAELAFLRGRALAAGKQWAMARCAFDDHLATHAPSAIALTERARVQQHLGDARSALDDYRAALKLAAKPEPDLVIETAEVLAAQAQRDEALRVLDDGMARLGQVPQLVLKAVELNVTAQRYDEALRQLEPMTKRSHAEPWLARRASVLAQAGCMAESITAWRELHQRIMALPAEERSSHAMCLLMAQAKDAVAALTSVAALNSTTSHR